MQVFDESFNPKSKIQITFTSPTLETQNPALDSLSLENWKIYLGVICGTLSRQCWKYHDHTYVKFMNALMINLIFQQKQAGGKTQPRNLNWSTTLWLIRIG